MKALFALCIISVPVFLFLKNTTGDYNVDSREWEQAADERIELYRKGDLIIKFNHFQSEDYTIEIEQLRHAFSFGTAVQASMILDSTENGEKYRSILKQFYNEVVFENDLKWHNWKDEKNGKYFKSQTLKALDWLIENKIKVRGHCLAWCPLQPYDKFYNIIPENVYNNPGLYKKALFQHIDDILKSTDSKIFEWDVLNHPVTRSQYFQVENETGKLLITDYLGENIYEEIISKIRKTNENTQLFVNEDNILTYKPNKKEPYYKLITKLITDGNSPSGIGFMGHFRSNELPKIENIQKTLNTFSSFKLPLKITEFDVLFGEMNQNYILNERESKLQADFTKDFLKICFSNPSIEGFLMWGFWEKAHWYPSASLWNKNWQIKTNGKAFIDLTSKTWRSNIKAKLNNLSEFKTRVFLGDYNLKVYNKTGQLTFQKFFQVSKEVKKTILNINDQKK